MILFLKKLNFVANNRYLVREDEFLLIMKDSKKNRKLFLFNDILIIARQDWRDKLHLIEKSSLRDCRVSEMAENKCESLLVYKIY